MVLKTVIWGLLLPFAGTAAGAACVFFLKKDLNTDVQRALTGFAAGVMVAASIWSLIVPAIEQSAARGRWAFLPAFIGFWLGILFLFVEQLGCSAGIVKLIAQILVVIFNYVASKLVIFRK